MQARVLFAFLGAALASSAAAVEGVSPGEVAPNNDVTFEVPINLTQLAADVRQIDVTCYVTSDAVIVNRNTRGPASNPRLTGHTVLDVGSGRLVTTANVVVAVPPDRVQTPDGKTFNYECSLTGYSAGTRRPRASGGFPAGWSLFAADHTNPSFRLSPTPKVLSGSFTW